MSLDCLTCPDCDARLHEAATHCHTCGAPAAALKGAGAAEPSLKEKLPQIYVTTRDYGRLTTVARACLEPDHPVARFLAAELERAVVCRPEDILNDVVTMNSRILYQAGDDGEIESRTLVYPDQYFPTGQYLSVLSPWGVALLGLREGSRMPFTDLQGCRLDVLVKKVACQPEARSRRAAHE